MDNITNNEQLAQVVAQNDIMVVDNVQVLTEADVLNNDDLLAINPLTDIPQCWDFDRFGHTMRVAL